MKLTFFITCILGIQIMVAQTTQTTGTITDAETGEPLVGAQVMVKGTSIGTTTDQNGVFSLKVDTGATLVITYIGYQTKEAFGLG